MIKRNIVFHSKVQRLIEIFLYVDTVFQTEKSPKKFTEEDWKINVKINRL